MRAGSLGVRLTLERPVRTPDGAGGATIAWTAVTGLWGELRPLSGRERTGAGGRLSDVTHDITLRHRAGVLPEMRLVAGSRVFHILAVLDDEAGRRLVCHCREEVRA
jgi:SPP1 family predicted phage head-tail adaptor